MPDTAHHTTPAPSEDVGQVPSLSGHLCVATVATPDVAAACQAIRAAADPHGPAAEWVEVRLDAFWPAPPDEGDATELLLRLTDAARAAGVRLLATLRPLRQGGRFKGAEEVRLGLLVAAARAGCQAVDVEADAKDPAALVHLLRREAGRVVLSDHALPKAPTREDGMLRLLRMMDARPDVEKIAFPSGAFPDALRALELAHAHAHRGGRPAVAPIGHGGAMLRALLPLAGARATYGRAAGLPAAAGGPPALADVQAIWDHWGLTGADLDACADPPGGGGPAGWYAVLGDPVAHSLSPRLHNAALRAADRSQRCGALQVPFSLGATRLVALVAGRIGLLGASVTAPLKQQAGRVAQGDDTVDATGAANCLRFDRTGAHATNTDFTAFTRILRTHDTTSLAVFGAGGAARAALAAAARLGIPASFSSRDPERAAAVEADLGAAWVPWAERTTMRSDTVVQATPATGAAVVPPSCLDAAHQGVELVYGDAPTPFEAEARRRGIFVVDGRAFLVEQALDAYRFWTGQAPERATMEGASR